MIVDVATEYVGYVVAGFAATLIVTLTTSALRALVSFFTQPMGAWRNE